MSKYKWFISSDRIGAPRAKMDLFCFHHAGGAASFYNSWSALISPQINVIAVQLPGREARFGEPFPSSIEDVVHNLVSQFDKLNERPFAIFGHSLGALIGFEFAKRLGESGGNTPRFFVSSGHGAPRRGPVSELLHDLPDAIFVSRMREKYGGISAEIIANNELLSFLLPRLRADIVIAERYVATPRRPVNFPIVALHGRADASVSSAELNNWKEETSTKVRLYEFEGDHFFIDSQRNQVTELMNKLLAEQLFLL